MTPFKKQLDKELGETRFFTKELQATILQNAKQPQKKKRHWQYPVVLTSALAIILLFIMIGPWVTVNPSQQTLNELVQIQSVRQFSMESNWEEESFKAGRVGWMLGQKDFQQGPETKILDQVLQHAQQSEEDTEYRSFRDLWIQFEDGQIAKLKMKSRDEQLAFVDLNTGLFYKVEDLAATDFIALLNEFDREDLFPNAIFFVLLSMLFIRWIVERGVRNVFHIQKESKYISRGHQLATIICSVVSIFIMVGCIIKGWLFYYVVLIGIVITVGLSKIMMDYYYGRDEKRHYIAIADTIIMWISLVIFLLFVKM